MLCPSCNKFAANSADNEPEVELEVSEDGQVTGNARIVITSECCGDELKEANFDVDIESDAPDNLEAHLKEHKCDLSVECDAETIDRYETEKTKTLKSGEVVVKQIKSRYQTHFYGVSIHYTVNCSCEKDGITWQGEWADEIPAGSMDELV